MKRLASSLALTTALSAANAFAQVPPPAPGQPDTNPAASADETAPAPPPTAPPPAAPPPAPAAAPPAAAPPVYGWQAPAEPSAAPAPSAPVADRAPEEPLPPAGSPVWQGWLGVRSSYVKSSGYDPFASNDSMIGGSLGASVRLFDTAPLSFALGTAFDWSGSESTARGAPTKLLAYRLLLAPEVRYSLIPELYFFARPSLGVLRSVASIDESATGVTLYSRAWLAAADLDAGVAVAFWDLRSKKSDLRFWLVADGGYAWAQEQTLTMEPDADSGAPERTASLELGRLAVRGPYFRVAVAATF
jgi:hypothetical protein